MVALLAAVFVIAAASPSAAQTLSESTDINVWNNQVTSGGGTVLTDPAGYQCVGGNCSSFGGSFFTIQFNGSVTGFRFYISDYGTCCTPSYVTYSIDGGPTQQLAVRSGPGSGPTAVYLGISNATPFSRIHIGTNSVGGGDVLNAGQFAYTGFVAVPAVNSLSPNTGSTSGGNSVVITGANLTGATAVSFGGTPATSFVVDSATQITAVVPAHAVGTVDVTVTTPTGTSIVGGAADDYTYTTPPGVTGITPTSVGNPTVGTPYSTNLTATDCVGPCTFTVTSGALPPGVTLSSTGVLSGTPTAGGPFNFTITATDAGASGQTASQAYSVTVAAPTLTVTGSGGGGGGGAMPGGQAGGSYNQTFTGSGGTAPYTYAVTSGALPPGVTLSSTGQLTGTPTGVGTYTFTVTTTDSSTGVGAPYSTSASYTITVAAPAIVVAPGSLPNAQAAVAYNQTITASGGTGPYTYAVTSGSLPAGVTLSSTGVLSGSPTAGGTFNFTITATDSTTGGTFTGSTAYSLVVAAPAIVLSTAPLPNATVAVSGYSQTITATGGNGPYTYAVTAGALPAGMSLSSAGVLSGTPTAGGSFNFTVTATDSTTGGTFTGSQAYNLIVNAAAIVVTPTTVPAGTRGFAYSQSFSATGGVGTYTYDISAGALPAGMSLSSTGVLSGTPTVTGTFNFTVRATDQSTGTGPYSGTTAITLVVNAATITVTPTTLPTVMAGLAYDRQLSATGGAGTYTYSITSGALPSGITLSSTGRISGASYAVGSYTVTVRATDSFGNTGSVTLVLHILTRPDPSADPDVRALDAAQAEATRRLSTVQIENFTRRLERLHAGGGDETVTNNLTLNSGVADIANIGQEADLRTRFGGGRMFGQQTQIDPDRAELNNLLWRDSAQATVMGSDGALNAAPIQSGGSPSRGVRFWTGGAITIGERDGDNGQASFSVRSSGISLGADMPLSDSFDIGIGGGFGEESADIGSADSSVDSNQFVGVIYASFRPEGGMWLDGILGYGQLEFDLQRRVSIDNSLVTGERDGTAMFGSISVGYDSEVSIGRMSAYGRLETIDAELDAYTETGSALWALSYAERDVESRQGVLGARYAWTHEERDSIWTPTFRFEYRHEFADGGVQSLQYADWLSGPTYQIQSSGWDRSEISVGLGLNVATTDGWRVSSELGARLATNQTAGTLRLMVSKRF